MKVPRRPYLSSLKISSGESLTGLVLCDSSSCENGEARERVMNSQIESEHKPTYSSRFSYSGSWWYLKSFVRIVRGIEIRFSYLGSFGSIMPVAAVRS